MKDNYEQNLPCTFAEQLAAYLYDEISDTEKGVFETHLQSCRICTNELTDFGALHSSIVEWRDNDFAVLQTPVFVLPALREIVEEKRSWFESLREFFTISPARATFASLAALILLAGLLWFASGSFNHEELADLSNTEKEIVKEQSQSGENVAPVPTPPSRKNTAQVRSVESIDKDVSAPDSPSDTGKNLSGKSVVAPDKVTAIPVIQKNSTKQTSPKKVANPKIKTPAKSDVPAMDDDDDDNDDSLRLTDLFDEIGMSNSGDKEESK